MQAIFAPTAKVEVIGTKSRHTFEAIVDTGFTGYVCIPRNVGEKLELALGAVESVELGDGKRVDQFMFDAQVRFLDRSFQASILLTDSETALIGTLLLSDCRMTIDFPSEKIKIVRKDM